MIFASALQSHHQHRQDEPRLVADQLRLELLHQHCRGRSSPMGEAFDYEESNSLDYKALKRGAWSS